MQACYGFFNSLYVAPASNRPPSKPESSPLWTDPACKDTPPFAVMSPEDRVVAGLTAQIPGKLLRYVTSHLTTIKTTINKSYFEEIEYVKVQAFRKELMDPVQFQHCLASVSDKDISADGWSRCTDTVSIPPDLLKPSDYSLLEPQDKIPDGNASTVAFMNYILTLEDVADHDM